MCCGSPDAEGLCTPSRDHQCSQPRAKLEGTKVKFDPPVFSLSDKFQSHYEKYLTGSKANILFKVGPRLQPPRSL